MALKNQIKVTSTQRKPKLTPCTVTVQAETSDETLILGLYQSHITVGDDGIFSGAGCGNPWITFRWKGKHGRLHAVDLLAAWVKAAGFEADAKRIVKSK